MNSVSESTEAHVRRYIALEIGRDDPVKSIQAVAERRVAGSHHEIFDVQCTKSRWWVITNATCLYSQAEFETYEKAFTYHVGLEVLHAEQRRVDQPPGNMDAIAAAWRRIQQATGDMHTASEAADYQSIGLKCRDSLIAAVAAVRSGPKIDQLGDAPKAADVKSWAGALASAFAQGAVRGYVSAVLYRVWDLTVWLQHNSGATEDDADIVLCATRWAVELFALLLQRAQVASPERCPKCESYRLQESGNPEPTPDGWFRWWTWRVCDGCGWESEHVIMTLGDEAKDNRGT